MPDGLIGPLISPWDVEQAVIGTLRTWLPDYLAYIEEIHGFQNKSLERPPAPESYHGGTKEAISWDADGLPEIIVTVEPTGSPELTASIGYIQDYEVEVWCIVQGDDGAQQLLPEDSARMQASYYGAAAMLLTQQGSLEGFAERTELTGSPRVECPDPEKRRQQAAITTFLVSVGPIIQPTAGPFGPNPQESPEYGGEPEAPFTPDPEATEVDVTVDADPIDT
jgi:hypothetical protein